MIVIQRPPALHILLLRKNILTTWCAWVCVCVSGGVCAEGVCVCGGGCLWGCEWVGCFCFSVYFKPFFFQKVLIMHMHAQFWLEA